MSDKPIKFDTNDVKTENIERDKDVLSSMIDALDEDSKQLPVDSGNAKLLKPKPKSKFFQVFGISFSVLILSAVTFEAWQFISQLFQINAVLGWSVATLAGVTLITGLGSLLKGHFKGKRLKQRQQLKKQLALCESNNSYGQANPLLDELNSEFSQEVDISKSLAIYQQSAQTSHNDAELIKIYSDQVLSGLDKLALEIISKHATESALMVALSPLAAADMALVAWRSNKMLQEVSRIYGCPQTAFGRLGLSKQVATNLMLAGASELVADAGIELLGKGLAATISTKAAQGIGVGLLIARFGIQSMRLCRPVEFDASNKPKLSDMRKLITGQVVSLASKENKKPELGEQDDRT